MKVALVNTNRIRPPIAPIGLEYVAEAAHRAGHEVDVLDLAWAPEPLDAIEPFFARRKVGLVGITLRNSDDCAFTSRESFLGPFAAVVARVRSATDAIIAVGGVGFSVMPERVLAMTGADLGIWGEGEFTFPALAHRIEAGEDYTDLPNLLWQRDDRWMRNPPSYGDLAALPPMGRRWFDNLRYFNEGGQAGIETKRGCPKKCTYCADPVAKGNRSRLRPPAAVADELEALLSQGIDHFHTCDPEFNVPEIHGRAVCEEIIRRGLGSRMRWYAYCAPSPFSRETAHLMVEAGCAGINFGADHADEGMLRRLKRAHTPEDILNVARWCKAQGIAVMFDLLIGAPGETENSIRRTIEVMKRSDADRAGVAMGIRVWPGTELAAKLLDGTPDPGLIGGDDPTAPLYYLDPGIADTAAEIIDDLVAGDNRFLFFNPKQAKLNYNYNDNQTLVDAIAAGYRGAYWDILRRLEA